MTSKMITVCCPTCKKTSTWTTTNKARPFCSDRCKLIDLGEWAEANHAIPGDPAQSEHLSGDNDSEE